MFTLWYVYLGFEEFRRRGYFQWFPWWKTQDNAGQPAAEITSKPAPKPDIPNSTEVDTSIKMDLNPSPNERNVSPQNKSSDVDKSQEIQSPEKPIKPPSPPASTAAKTIDKPTTFESPMASEENLRFPRVSENISNDSFILKEKDAKKKNDDALKKKVEHSEEGEGDENDKDSLLKVKDSKLLIASEISDKRQSHPVRNPLSTTDAKLDADKKKITFTEKPSDELSSNVVSRPVESTEYGQNNPTTTSDIPTRSSTGRNRVFLEGSDEPMRCWLTEGDHPDHPADDNVGIGAHNIKLLSNRSRDSADSILRDSDEFLMNERHLSRQTSWPKKVSISEEPPTTFIRDIPPADNSETEIESSPVSKLKREAELAAAAAAALKEDWRKRMERESSANEPTDPDDDETIVFGDSDDPDVGGQLVELSDDEDQDLPTKTLTRVNPSSIQ